MTTLAEHVINVLADDSGGSDPWAQRLTAGAAFVTAVLGGLGTFRIFTSSGRQRGDQAVRDAENDDHKVTIDPEDMQQLLQLMLKQQITPPPQSAGTQPLGEPPVDPPTESFAEPERPRDR